MRYKPSIFPLEFKSHFERLQSKTIEDWIGFKNQSFNTNKTPQYIDVVNSLLDAVETEFIKDPEFVWIAAKAGVQTGQLKRVLDNITWKHHYPFIRGQGALALTFLGKTSEALDLINAAEAEAEKKEDLEVLLELYGIKTFALTVENKYQEAIGVFIKASQLTQNDKSLTYWLQLASTRYAYSLLKLGYYEEATRVNNKVLSFANHTGDRFYKVLAFTGLGHCLDRVKKPEEALKLYDKGLKISEQIQSLNLSSIILNRIGMSIAWRKRKLEESVDYFRRAIASAQEGDSEWLIFGPMANLAIIKKMTGNYFEAQELFEGVKDRAESCGLVRDQVFAYINLSDIYKELGDKIRSIDYKNIAQDLAKSLQSEYSTDNDFEKI
ncbi:MAG: tetratricopeptide repeat protein [Candidatus Hodarchaeales archaeon]|jgi:tetratricopeptide (TPR) repeat protein